MTTAHTDFKDHFSYVSGQIWLFDHSQAAAKIKKATEIDKKEKPHFFDIAKLEAAVVAIMGIDASRQEALFLVHPISTRTARLSDETIAGLRKHIPDFLAAASSIVDDLLEDPAACINTFKLFFSAGSGNRKKGNIDKLFMLRRVAYTQAILTYLNDSHTLAEAQALAENTESALVRQYFSRADLRLQAANDMLAKSSQPLAVLNLMKSSHLLTKKEYDEGFSETEQTLRAEKQMAAQLQDQTENQQNLEREVDKVKSRITEFFKWIEGAGPFHDTGKLPQLGRVEEIRNDMHFLQENEIEPETYLTKENLATLDSYEELCSLHVVRREFEKFFLLRQRYVHATQHGGSAVSTRQEIKKAYSDTHPRLRAGEMFDQTFDEITKTEVEKFLDSLTGLYILRSGQLYRREIDLLQDVNRAKLIPEGEIEKRFYVEGGDIRQIPVFERMIPPPNPGPLSKRSRQPEPKD